MPSHYADQPPAAAPTPRTDGRGFYDTFQPNPPRRQRRNQRSGTNSGGARRRQPSRGNYRRGKRG
ncbi:hypothetical protein ER308_07105 [Egibacter rhizosphaerae]|uniref:Uncharacterized protein n=1 Tax=Egibacter rhizosphaerae TaxID=1670831 RepID=A0A411YDM4_9ACTN|nr:hypothetical protein [Egibacter rhizosphaerae]QBI19334.1 hypothetical protein ER308_07105 [Egibacter rhizosphaerae]